MTDLPWDRFPDEELPYVPPPAPAPPVEPTAAPQPSVPVDSPPPAPTPARHAAVDWGDILDDAWPAIREQVIEYAKGTIQAGFQVDHTHPTITATTQTGRELVVADAKSRSWRTLIQGLIFDVFAAIVAAVALLSGADPFVKETWVAFGVLVFKSVVSAVISYFMRLKITPTMKTEGERYAIAPVPRPMPEEKETA